MADEKRPSRNLIGKAIRSERQTSGQVDLDNLNDTLAKSSLWKTNTLRRIENNRSSQDAETGGANDDADAVLQSLKRSLLQLVDQHWNQQVSGSAANGDLPSEDQRTALVDAAADTQRRDTRLQNEYNGMRKSLSVQVKEVIKVRRRLRKQEKKVKNRDEEISQLQKTIVALKADNTSLTEQHERNIAELQAENSRLYERHEQAISKLQADNTSLKDCHERSIAELRAENASLKDCRERSIAELRAENASLQERHTEEIYSQQARLLELQDAYDQFQQQSDQLLTELDRENALLRSGETPANDDAQFAPFDVNAQ